MEPIVLAITYVGSESGLKTIVLDITGFLGNSSAMVSFDINQNVKISHFFTSCMQTDLDTFFLSVFSQENRLFFVLKQIIYIYLYE